MDNFSGALAAWKNINFSELQKTLDAQGIELVENQKESIVGRKALADRTKEFKKIPDEEKLTAFKGLLKSYQTEIDNLTKRSKFAENAFLSVYKVLAEAPDPYPLLEAVVDQTAQLAETAELQSSVDRLREENASLKQKVNDLNGLEVRAKKAESKVETLEARMEDVIQEKVLQKENELNATYDEKMRNYEEREQDLQRQLSLSRTQLRELRMSVETSQAKLLNQTERQDQETISKLAEMDMLVADLERANSRVVTVERRNELLRAEIENMKSGSGTSERVQSLEEQISSLEAETERLARSLDAQREATEEVQREARKKVEAIQREMESQEAEVRRLKGRLEEMKDYDEVKRELDILKYVEFGGMDQDEEDEASRVNGYTVDNSLGLALPSPNPNADKGDGDRAKSLEVLLASKNKRILDELAKFRIDYAELEASVQRTQTELERATTELERQKALNERLENDLVQMDQHKSQGPDDSASAGELARKESALAGLDLGKRTSNGDSPARTTPIPFTSSADTSILPIVTSQRDRFRQRNAELEEELRKQFQIISELRTEIKTLQADNLKLYEKVRYMQSYREESSRRHAMSTLDPLPGNGDVANDDMSKYRTRYEEAMNPFEAFRGREAARAYGNLNPMERGVLGLTRAILGNRRARNAFIFYALALHMLVMYTTYECTTSGGTQLQKQPVPH
ncbi:hypothetical protein NEOLEDRAFT_1090011 [Neolentinus lepideus HHB14362 ss-1]|uniref:Protein CASP n=1 Tax=Neolentinus lepideus HHB14362 ss-1 TaxID=1314782 RepID=A0A165TH97_9AGAM|nr:hypothetical protein NEOLEDRAFT_1090011 [Neolentinus lepideus HHB14362 ss-1]